MAPELLDELAQGRPFASLQHEAQLAIVRTGTTLIDSFERMLRPHGITATQYNVLRILRGAGPEGLCRNEVRDRMLTRMPDVTRLLDRMEEAGLIARSRQSQDRRMVSTLLTEQGRQLLDSLQGEVAEEQTRPFAGIPEDDLRRLIALLRTVREQA